MKACATAGGGVMFLSENVKRKVIKLSKDSSNENAKSKASDQDGRNQKAQK